MTAKEIIKELIKFAKEMDELGGQREYEAIKEFLRRITK